MLKQPFGTFTFDGHRDPVRWQVETIRVSRADTAMVQSVDPDAPGGPSLFRALGRLSLGARILRPLLEAAAA
jgi:hypothetical protein